MNIGNDHGLLVNTLKYSWLNVMLILLPVAWGVVSKPLDGI